jgi:hypothetical protein
VGAPLNELLVSAEDHLWADFRRAGQFSHNGLAGSGREGAVAMFLREHLPQRFVVTSGEAVDANSENTTQLDLVVYDSHLSAPLLRASSGPELLPAEALLAVVEVKTTFSKAEAANCIRAVASLTRLQPYGVGFVTSRTGGLDAADGAPRCMYSILAFNSDLAEANWASREWDRLRDAATAADVDVARIDRLTVLERGLIVPPTCTALSATSDKGILRDWFLHLTDFLIREAARRRPYDWHRYARERAPSDWERLEGYRSVNEARRERVAADAAKGESKAKGSPPRGGRTVKRGRRKASRDPGS